MKLAFDTGGTFTDFAMSHDEISVEKFIALSRELSFRGPNYVQFREQIFRTPLGNVRRK